MSAHRLTESPLDTAETSFRLLTTGPGSLPLNGSTIAAELPRGMVCLRELRMLLTSRHVSDDTRDAVWRELVTRARQSGSTWTVAAVGMAIPALRMIALSLTRTLSCGDPVDVDSAIMAGYLRAIHRVDVDLPDIRPRMCEAARCAGQHAIRYMAERQRTDESTSPRRPWFHPDLVLIDAVADGVLSELDAELITLSRLEDVPLRTLRTVLKRHHRDLPPAQLQDSEPSSTAVDEEAQHTASARSQGTPDAETATDPKGGRGTTPDSARISPNHPSVAGRARRTGQQNPARHPTGRRPPSTRWIVTWALAVTAVTVLLIAAVATGAFAASAVPSDLNSVLNNLRNWMIGLLAGLATLMLTIGGLRYLVAGGDPGEVQKAKGALKAAAFGYALAVLAPLFVSVLKRIVGG
ncbi:pilin [Nonomuraea glycinis]|uniref:Uncharacterized protein n=1 Tax=Nonomuraea glycinis TaxID=2047744 RepID=A0A918E785_9ACTN|nr:pilin [Nonomuraea glycinis]MCA2178430.1 pilin [Nonomuraea glycinis]GGP12271.1 hypothetical protein GCM10012278_59390 [Nonomuraea glycinis]